MQAERIKSFLDQKEVKIERVSDKGSKTVEIRQYVLDARCEGDLIFLRIRITDRGTARPNEVLRTFGISLESEVRLKKTYSEVSKR